MFEQVNKLKNQLSHEKKEVARKQVEIDELTSKIELMADADKVMIDLRQRLDERDRMMASLRQQLDESLIEREALLREAE